MPAARASAHGQVEPEDVTPVTDRQYRRPQQRAHHAAELLHGTDDSERQPAPLGGPQVGDQRQRRRYQSSTAHALEEATGDHRAEVVGAGGDQ
jgi:hypothetical protein